jgi:hypothetical protein
MKAHFGVDSRSKLIHAVQATPARERLNKRMEAWIWAWRFAHWTQNGFIGTC